MLLNQIAPFIHFANEVTIPRRRREDAMCADCRLILILSGSGKVFINGKGRVMRPGTLLFWQAGTVYRFSFKEGVQALVLDFDLFADGNNFEGSVPLILKRQLDRETLCCATYEFSDAAALNAPLVLENAFYMEERMRRVAEEFKKQTAFGAANASAQMKLALSKVAETAGGKQRDELAERIDRVAEYIHRNYQKALTNEQLAEQFGYHSYYLNRIFKQRKGCALHQYLLNCRLSAAAERLLSTDQPLSEIAEACGFNHPVSLINAFKKRYYMTPTEFRNQTV